MNHVMFVGKVVSPMRKDTTTGKHFWTFRLRIGVWNPVEKHESEVDKYCLLWAYDHDSRENALHEGTFILLTGEIQGASMKKADGGTYVAERIKVDKLMTITKSFTRDEEAILATKKEDEIPF